MGPEHPTHDDQGTACPRNESPTNQQPSADRIRTDGGNRPEDAENADGSVDGSYEVRVGDTTISYADPTQTARTLMEDAGLTDAEIDRSVLVDPSDETEYRPNDPVDLSAPGRERFFVQTRTDGNSSATAA
jgi:hypothetical protein